MDITVDIYSTEKITAFVSSFGAIYLELGKMDSLCNASQAWFYFHTSLGLLERKYFSLLVHSSPSFFVILPLEDVRFSEKKWITKKETPSWSKVKKLFFFFIYSMEEHQEGDKVQLLNLERSTASREKFKCWALSIKHPIDSNHHILKERIVLLRPNIIQREISFALSRFKKKKCDSPVTVRLTCLFACVSSFFFKFAG